MRGARSIGRITRQTVVAVEAGDYAPSVYLALAIARRLVETVERLFDEGTVLDSHADKPKWR